MPPIYGDGAHGALAQLVERLPCKQEADGFNSLKLHEQAQEGTWRLESVKTPPSSACGEAWSSRVVWDHEIEGSNPSWQTQYKRIGGVSCEPLARSLGEMVLFIIICLLSAKGAKMWKWVGRVT